jgi:pimeloyl-ACP methyl ester carboxylesterase
VLDLIAALVTGPLLLVGSSMGGWLMLLTALALDPEQVAGMVGIAPAPDFTEWGFSDAQKAIIHTEGVLLQDTPYGDQPTVTTRALWQSGHDHLLLDAPIALTCPAHLLHGQRDDDVPWKISLKLAAALASDDVTITLIKDGDHRLSRDSDIALLLRVVAGMARTD